MSKVLLGIRKRRRCCPTTPRLRDPWTPSLLPQIQQLGRSLRLYCLLCERGIVIFPSQGPSLQVLTGREEDPLVERRTKSLAHNGRCLSFPFLSAYLLLKTGCGFVPLTNTNSILRTFGLLFFHFCDMI